MNLYESVFKALPEPILLVDGERSRIVDANPAAEALCGRSAAELRETPYDELPAEVRGVASGGFTNADGRPVSIHVLTDSQRLREAAEAADLFLWEVAADGVFVYVSPAVERLIGYTPAEIVGKLRFQNWFAGELFARRQAFRALPTWTKTKDERLAAFESSGVPIRGADGNFLGYRGASAEVTERRRAEEALRQSEKIYRAIGESIDFGVWVCTPDGRNTYASESFLKLVGLTQEQCSSFGWGDVLHPDDAARAMAAWKECVRSEGRWDIEHRFRGVDGRWHPVLARGVPVRDEQGQITCWAGINLDIGELKRTQEELRQRESEARAMARELQVIMDAAPAAISIAHDPECRRISGNRAAYALLRQQPGSNLSKSADDPEAPAGFRVMHDGVEVAPSELPIQKVASSGQPIRNWEEKVVFEDGTTINLMGDVEPLLDEEGRPRGAVAVLSDVTQRRREELEIRKFLLLADNSVEFIGICDMNLMPFYANDAAVQLVGLDSREQALRTPVPEFFFPEDQRFITEEFFPRVIREGRAEVEIRFRHFKTGQPIWMIYNVFHIRDAAGQPVGLATVSRDITARRQTEAALRESEERFRNLADTAPVLIWTSGPDKLCTFFNQPWLNFTGRTLEQEAGNGWTENVHPDDFQKCLEIYSSSFDARRSFRMEYRLRRADGEYRWILDNGIPRYREGEFIGYIGSCIDVTEQKLLEGALRDSERQLRDLAGSLLTAQEDERRRLSRELHDDITQRLAFLSMELDRLAAELPASVESARVQARALQQQAHEISGEVRRISHGLHPSVISDFGLSVALEEFCHQFGKARGIRVVFEGFVEDARLDTTIATSLYRVAQESLRNAAVHGRATEIRVALTADRGSIHLRIRDNGTGFSTAVPGSRSGLGLISMQERLRFLRGKLTIASQPGRGTEITASVPLTGAGHETCAPTSG